MMPREATRTVRVLVVLALTLLATLGLAGTASAHATLIGSDPADGATLQAPPTTVTLTFDDTLENFEPVVTVTGPDGNQYQSGATTIDGVTLSSAVLPLTAAGTYTIAYRVVSDDGHPVEGQVRFDLAVPAPVSQAPVDTPVTTASASPTPTSSGSAPSSSAPSSSAPSSSASASAASTVTTGADAAASSSSTGWSVWQWLGVAVFLVLAFGASMVVRRRLETRTRTSSADSADS